ncbi:MAG: metallophosphoesterase [candidate division Zixibacteria bacterium]|nr:metallophosphoesterase [candidate division Zixibacteria bacterium]
MNKFLLNIFTLLLAVLLNGFLPSFAGQTHHLSRSIVDVYGGVTDTSNFIDSLSDGPYVFWETDTSVIVFYLCNEDMLIQTFSGADTLRFHGFCKDSAIEYFIPVSAPHPEPYIINHVPRILAISDIHGEYELLVKFLKESGVIDDSCQWKWEDGHLVIIGDIFDRGDRVTECLWFIRQLESEAERSGGDVHYLIGNHELMVLSGDTRYIHEKYLKGIVNKTKIKYEDLFSPEMELGRWLRSKNTVIKINDIIFVHAGLSPPLINKNLSLADINNIVRGSIDLRSNQLVFNELANFLFGGKGPFWYRGYHYEMENSYLKASLSEVESILNYYKASAIVVGHTEIDQVLGLYGNRIIAIDVPTEELGSLQGLLWKNGEFYRVTGKGDHQLIK